MTYHFIDRMHYLRVGKFEKCNDYEALPRIIVAIGVTFPCGLSDDLR